MDPFDRIAARLGLLLLAGVLSAVPTCVRAELRSEEPPREGWLLGLVLGRGSGDFTVSEGDLHLTSDWSSGGTLLRGRVGYCFTPRLVLTGEYGVWRRPTGEADAAESETEDVDRYLGSGLAAINLYPHLGGFLLRCGVGWGRGYAEVIRPEGAITADASGPMILLGLGYEWFLDDDLSVVAGADFGRIEGGDAISGNFAQFTVAFHGYLRHGLPREWF